MGRKSSTRASKRLTRTPVTLCAVATMWLAAGSAVAQKFDGITIIDFAEHADRALGDPPGPHVVVFVSPRGTYAAITPSLGSHDGCFSRAEVRDGGGSVVAGIDGDLRIRRHGIDTICPPLTVRFESADTATVEINDDSRRTVPDPHGRKVVAHMPIRQIDYASSAYARYDVRGVRLGPLAPGENVGPLPAERSRDDRYKVFNRQVGTVGRAPNNIQGRVAAASVTGWPHDTLYFTQFLHQLERTSTRQAFREAVIERYGNASLENEQSGYMQWLHNLDGRLVSIDQDKRDACRTTIEFWLKYDARAIPHGLNWDLGGPDLGPWGCSVVMELTPNHGDGGVTGYFVRLASGYAMAINHFYQRFAHVDEVMAKVRALQTHKPKL